MAPSPLYAKLHALALAHAAPKDIDSIMSIRHPDAIHAWGHNYLLSRNPKLTDRMDNAAFLAHLQSSGPFVGSGREEVHDIIVDEHKRRAVVHMSYFLAPKGSEEVVEQDLIWVLTFTGEGEVEGDVDGVLIKESVEFIDAAASARMNALITRLHGDLPDEVRGGFTVKGV